MLIGQAGSIGGKTRQEVEMMQWEQENTGKEEVDSSQSSPDHQRGNMSPAWLRKVPSCVANIDKNNGLI